MKKVGIREAQINLTGLLKDLPFAITRYGEVIAVVDRPKKEPTYPKEKPKTVGEVVMVSHEEFARHRCEVPNIRCPLPATHQYNLIIEGERKNIFLCNYHYNKALKEGAEVI